MNRKQLCVVVALALAVGATFGVVLAKKSPIEASTYIGKEPEEAADALLEIAKVLAASGSFENIYVSRVYFQSGRKEEAQAILDKALAKKTTSGDRVRLGRAYFQGGDWAKAKEQFDQVLAAAPKDEDWLAEIGAYYNLQGDREHAEELFRRSFAVSSSSLKNVLAAAGSYVGVSPLRKP